MSHEHIDSAKRINFEKLSNLVAERIYVLQEYVKAADRNDPTHDAICRDLVMPCIGLLARFIEAVNMSAEEVSE